MKHLKWILVATCVFLLIGVRTVESIFFYDPFLEFFRNIPQKDFPKFDWEKIILSHIFRFTLNLVFSLGVIHFLFFNKKWTLQASALILLSFAIFFPI